MLSQCKDFSLQKAKLCEEGVSMNSIYYAIFSLVYCLSLLSNPTPLWGQHFANYLWKSCGSAGQLFFIHENDNWIRQSCMYCRLVFMWYLHYTKLFQRNGWFQTAFYEFSVLQSICDLCIAGNTFPRMYDQWTTVWKKNFVRTFHYSIVKHRFYDFVCIIWCSGSYVNLWDSLS